MEYSFEEFIQDVNMGCDIEFIYNNERYFVTHNKEGWLSIKSNDNTFQCFNNANELLKMLK